eukprot:UN29478
MKGNTNEDNVQNCSTQCQSRTFGGKSNYFLSYQESTGMCACYKSYKCVLSLKQDHKTYVSYEIGSGVDMQPRAQNLTNNSLESSKRGYTIQKKIKENENVFTTDPPPELTPELTSE